MTTAASMTRPLDKAEEASDLSAAETLRNMFDIHPLERWCGGFPKK